MSELSGDSTKAHIRGSGLLLGGQIFSVVVNLAAQVLIVRYLSQESYGIFAFALSVASLMESVAGFGMRRGLSRYLPLYEEQRRLSEAAGTLVLSLAVVLLAGLLCVLVTYVFRDPIAVSVSSDASAVTTIILLALLAPLNALSSLLDGLFAVFSKPIAIAVRKYVLIPVTRIAAVVVLITLEQGIVFLSAVYVITAALGILIYIPMLIRVLRERQLLHLLRPSRYRIPAKEVFSFTTPLLTNDLTNVMLISVSAILLGFLSTASEVATLRAVMPVSLAMTYVLTSFGLLFLPLATRYYAHREWHQVNRLYWQTSIWTSVLAFPILIVCLGASTLLTVLLFGSEYENAAPVLAILAVGMYVETAVGLNEMMLGVFRKVRFIALSNLASVAVNLVLLLLLIPAYGAVGAAIATSATLIFLSLLRQYGLRFGTKVNMVDRSVLLPYATIAVSMAVAVLVTVATSNPVLNVGVVVASIIAVFVVAREKLEIEEFFPELARRPILGRFLTGRREQTES